MEALYSYFNQLLSTQKKAFASWPQLRWLNAWENTALGDRRQSLLQDERHGWLFKNTKPFHKHISKGCMQCGLGRWSCLFITNKCNGGCFYCPSAQVTDTVPSSQMLTFDTPEAYAEYVRWMNFAGVSFSGGEPLLYFERTLSYLQSVRRHCDASVYIWLYTNGIAGNTDMYRRLAAEGLDEIRFDIGATANSLENVKQACGIIPNITIEIPAVPEDVETLKALLPQMIDLGITNLNLHQMRLTQHNVKHLAKRNYTFVAAERPVVLESEMAALEILDFTHSLDWNIGINYCAFDYKNRFQKAGYRHMLAERFAEAGETITENGYIRKYNEQALSYENILLTDDQRLVANHLKTITLKHKVYSLMRTESVSVDIETEAQVEITALMEQRPAQPPEQQHLFEIWRHEYIEEGLRNYF
ncbi:MAG TPA: radical SAM protein [Bacteroidales bacterium]|nr:radical SAM protein [Bacteroidales bacterium]